jgi:predicted porin
MKKSLIALAVLAASGAAMAQSSVTMYGVADLSLAKSKGVSAQMSGNGLMNNGTSRLGVRGVEDLGGGLKASFNFEQGINAENGATSSNTFERAAWVALSGGFGKLQMGRAVTPSYLGTSAWELTGMSNYSVVLGQFEAAGAANRGNSQFIYSTNNYSGFSGSLGYTLKTDNGGNAKTDLNLVYANGPLAAALAYNKVKNGDKGLSLGASYDFGSVKVAGSLQDTDKVLSAIDPRGFTLGATVPFGAFSVTLDVARDTEYKDTDVLVEGKYALSKRTFAYAAYYTDGDKKAGSYTSVPYAKNHLGLGIRHNF